MRMWMLDPEMMCKKHIIGEHGEIHKHRHNFVSQHSIAGRIHPIVQISPHRMKQRHDQLISFLKSHNSPYEMPSLNHLPPHQRFADVDLEHNKRDLAARCSECRKLIEAHQKINDSQ